MKRVSKLALVALGLAACNRAPRTTWVETSPAGVRAEAQKAAAAGLVPLLYRDAMFTPASMNLARWHDTPEMRDALAGVAVIRIHFDDDANPPFLWHSFERLDSNGNPTGVILQPGTKDGPCMASPAECAAWVGPFVRSL